MAKVLMRATKKELEHGAETEKTERKCILNTVKSSSRTMSTRESSSLYECVNFPGNLFTIMTSHKGVVTPTNEAMPKLSPLKI